MTKAAILKRCKYWQKRLRLTNWDINFKVVSKADMPGDMVGLCQRWENMNTAEILILDPKDLRSRPFEDTIEATIVHELLHLIVSPLFRNPASDFEDHAQEAAIEAIAKGLVEI